MSPNPICTLSFGRRQLLQIGGNGRDLRFDLVDERGRFGQIAGAAGRLQLAAGHRETVGAEAGRKSLEIVGQAFHGIGVASLMGGAQFGQFF